MTLHFIALPTLAVLALTLLTLPPLLQARTLVYNGDAIEGAVVDAKTDKPLEGVNIVVNWEVRSWLVAPIPISQIHIDEAVTDKDGRYLLKSWGPKFALLGHLRDGPRLMYFKSGYKLVVIGNHYGSETSRSDWNKKTIKLEKFNGTLKEYAYHLNLSSLSSLWQIGFAIGDNMGDYCGWRAFPKMLRALDMLENEYREAGIKDGTVVSNLKANDKHLIEQGCGSVLDVLGGAKK